MAQQINTYPERESKTLEFTESLPAFLTLIKTCVAFANTAGGQIIIGIEDETRKVIGVKNTDREKLYESFPNSLFDATNNGLFVHIYERNLNSKSVLVIDVPLSTRRPCFIKKDGIPKGVYLRVGASTRRAHKEHIEELMMEAKYQYYDSQATNLKYDALSQHLVEKCYGQSFNIKKLIGDGIVVESSITPKEYYATIAGVLMFCENPQEHIPESIIICTEFSGTQGRNIKQTRELTGPIPQLIHESLTLLDGWLSRHFELKGAKLEGQLPIPKEALREGIINGLLHRKYSIPGALKIAIYDDRLEIFSPGCFPGLVDINHLGDGTTYLRNPHISKIARRLKLIEKIGTGIKLIFESCKRYGIQKPQYREDGDFVKLIFYFVPSVEETDSDQEIILKYLNIHGVAKINDFIDLLGISRNTATRKLNELIKKKLIYRKGKGPAVRYYRS